MRKLKLQMHISLDGFVGTKGSGPLHSKWDDGLKKFSIDMLRNTDCILLGRVTAEGFIPYWTQAGTDPEANEHELGKLFTLIPKVVFSNKLTGRIWDNTTILKGDIAEQIKALKEKKGRDIIIYGGSSFVSSLIENGLIDEFNLLVNPIALGSGEAIFNRLTDLEFVSARPSDCGVNILTYKRAEDK
jgi:dihydrofolate reductase